MPQESNLKELSFSATDHSSLYNNVHNIFIAIDSRGRIAVFNPACEKAFNVSAKKALGRLVTDVVPFTGLIKVLKTGKSHIGRKFVLGNTLYIANRTPVIKNGAVVGAIGVAQEVSEIQQLARERDDYKLTGMAGQTVMQESSDGYLIINNEGYILFINNTLAGILELDAASATGRHVTEFLPETEFRLLPFKESPSGQPVNLRGKKGMLSSYPLKLDGKTAGIINRINFHRDAAKIEREQHAFPRQYGCRYTIDNIIGNSPQMKELKKLIRKVARGPSSILITGDSGTGKELVAQALHTLSTRRNCPFIKVNCAALPKNLLESELFGYREGAFTGARKGGQKGKFQLAHGGTIFLDEIGDMPLSMQAKLLRVLQEREIERLGDNKIIPIDVRVIASTNQNIIKMVSQGTFRKDLYYRLNVINLTLPPLRERPEDLHLLVHHFITKFNAEFGLEIAGITDEVRNLFETYEWPGNIRELENMMERAFNLVEGNYIEIKHLPHYMQNTRFQEKKTTTTSNNLPALIEQVEKKALARALINNNGNKARAAQELGISRAWLYKKLKHYNIEIS